MTELPGAASLVHQLDKRVLVVLRDGKHFVGTLSSFDPFGNFVLERTCERHYAGGAYADTPIGLHIIRGENVVLLGEIDDAKEAALPLRRVAPSEMDGTAADEGAAESLYEVGGVED